MPLFVLRTANITVERIDDPGNPETWPSPSFESNTRLLAGRYFYCEEVTAENPETTHEGKAIAEGNYCIWHEWYDGSYRRAEAEREFFQRAYMPLDELLPDEDPTTRTDRPDIAA